ncbi:MAG: lysozyme [Bacteroidaceae bacterium]|nr:lysozyme [Bacteroidaceae bacterium]
MKPSKQLFQKLKEFEGLRLEAYLDAAGVPTIGYGHTKDVRMGDRISAYWAEELLQRDVERVAKEVEALHVAQTQGQLDALVSFAFNLGTARLRRSTLLRVIREGRGPETIRREFCRWVFAAGRRQPGLVRRRQWEADRYEERETEGGEP